MGILYDLLAGSKLSTIKFSDLPSSSTTTTTMSAVEEDETDGMFSEIENEIREFTTDETSANTDIT